jgi:hypothetical protein
MHDMITIKYTPDSLERQKSRTSIFEINTEKIKYMAVNSEAED